MSGERIYSDQFNRETQNVEPENLKQIEAL